MPGDVLPVDRKECFNSSGVTAVAAKGFTSTLPWGSVVIPAGTAIPSGMGSPSATTTAFNSNTLTTSTHSNPPAVTFEAVSEASVVINGSIDIRIWMLLATMLFVGAWFV